MIEILYASGSTDTEREEITWEEIKALVSDDQGNDLVEMHVILEDGKPVQTFCNEEGALLRLQKNPAAYGRARGKLLGPCFGNWVFLSGEHLLEDDDE
jgi:hypothetical protein